MTETQIPRIENQASLPKKKRFSVLKLFLNVAIYLAIVLGTIFGLPKFLSWKLETPYPMAAITSGSMWPALKEGDLVFIRGVKSMDELKVGDVVVYRNKTNDTLTIHRIEKTDPSKDQIVTKGDANFNADEPTKFENVIGKTVTIFGRYARIPDLGFITVTASKIVNSNVK